MSDSRWLYFISFRYRVDDDYYVTGWKTGNPADSTDAPTLFNELCTKIVEELNISECDLEVVNFNIMPNHLG